MDQFVTAPSRLRRPGRPGARRRLAALAAVGLSLTLAGTGCSDGGSESRAAAAAGGAGAPAAVAIQGPLCDALPTGTEPGNPASLTKEPPEAALQWIPVLTTFESAVRAAGLANELHRASGVTILAPSDDAFEAQFSEDDVDKLFIAEKDKLRDLLREHLVAGSLSLADLEAAGEVTTLAGSKIRVTGGGTTARLADKADTVCADYRAADARIHIINRVLGNLPVTGGTGHKSH
ncbi:fasciclin domain-containing protein [Micromonospora narathiwatensis]|uniref:Uncaracterized surface protein containing fasciclin (FAS1) repeats n=1 Tax=Micromonospora narathiwatensis TaxID=299146 RepID=A0A1A8ZCP1_9ACTN|nr:fasciclin domain-containing protein [Micromonospora narathiwatensis]SBT41571.1 Uncaracterized surface protein containing fasciclin (FAS1) repeats [Micromonospora narathiwatensis]